MSLENHKCYFCKKEVTVARISPCRTPEKLTGIWLRYMDEDYNEKTVGVVCKECAFSKDHKLNLGFSGGRLGNLDNWEAYLE